MRKKKTTNELFAATRNIRSLVEDAGDARICRATISQADSAVDRELDFLVAELEKFEVDIAGIQETRWFGNDVWSTAGSTFLHSGRPLPTPGEPARRNEGVGILMNSKMTKAWRLGGEQWRSVSSRVVSARFLLGAKGDRLRSGSRHRTDYYLTVIAAYAPTAKAPIHVRNRFNGDLQVTLDNVPGSDILLILGDFNARVGSRQVSPVPVSRFNGVSDDQYLWGSTLGPFGLGECNKAGEEFLLWCSGNQPSIMNSFFRKKISRRGTWTHPATKQHHTIDYVVMRSSQRSLCKDVSVLRSALCWTDHHLVRTKIILDFVPRRSPICRKKPHALHLLCNDDVSKAFRM